MSSGTASTGIARAPFPGLRSFSREESELFFGREGQSDELARKLGHARFVAVVGTSGSGKSSLVRAGLLPSLESGCLVKAGSNWRIVDMRPGNRPFDSLAAALDVAQICETPADPAVLRGSSLALLDFARQAYEQKRIDAEENLLVLVDQFEELFRYPARGMDERDEKAAFVKLLLEVSKQRAYPVYVVITMRSDFLGDCARFRDLPDTINAGQYLVPRMTRDQRREAIEGPIHMTAAAITPRLVQRILNDVGEDPDQLPLMQHALMRTWYHWRSQAASKAIDIEDYIAIGTLENALSRHADDAYTEACTKLPQRGGQIVKRIFQRLRERDASGRETRRPTSLGELCAVSKASQEEEVQEEVLTVLECFRREGRSFLMPPMTVDLTIDSGVDITHESLLRQWKRLQGPPNEGADTGWLAEEEESRRTIVRLADRAEQQVSGNPDYLRGPLLQLASDWWSKRKPTEIWAERYTSSFQAAETYLRDSEASQRRELEKDRERQRAEESARQRELQQAKDLAHERQRRIAQQARYTRWLSIALAVMAVLVVALVVVAGWIRKSEKRALEAKNAKEQAFIMASRERDNALKAQQKAEVAEAEAKAAESEMFLEALRARDTTLTSQSDLSSLADTFLEYSGPQRSELWNRMKGSAQLRSGNYDDAEESLKKALTIVPDDISARIERGYMYVLRMEPQKALEDFEHVRKLDRESPLNNLNLAVTYAAIGNYRAARASLNEAIRDLPYKAFEGGSEDAIPPEITRATGRVTLEAQSETFEAALYYMRANLEAYEGHVTKFKVALDEADKTADRLSQSSRQNAYFIAMTWVWLHLRIRCPDSGGHCKDYGGLASQAYLWEKAGYKTWAGCFYEKFSEKNERWKDQRYVALPEWVQQRRTELHLPSTFSCKDFLKEPSPDVPELEVRAREAAAKENFQEAITLLDQAVGKAGPLEQPRLLLQKAFYLYKNGRSEKERAQNASLKGKDLEEKLSQLEQQKRTEEQKPADYTKNSVLADYTKQIERAKTEKKSVADEKKKHDDNASNSFKELKNICNQILKKNPQSAKAYFWRAIAQDWLAPSGSSREMILADIHRALRLDLAYSDALGTLDAMVPDPQSAGEAAYLERYGNLLDFYHKTSPTTADVFKHKYQLLHYRKQDLEAFRALETAIEMNPVDLELYELRAEAERSMGVNETQVSRNQADGYRRAGDVETRRGHTDRAAYAYKKAWEINEKLAKNQAGEDLRCNPDLVICTATTMVEQHSEVIVSGIATTGQRAGNLMQAFIDKGNRDGAVVGSRGVVYSHQSTIDGHERGIKRIGMAELVSVEPDRALVRIEMESPESDGVVREDDLVRKDDFVWMNVLTPAKPARSSQLWSLAKFNATFLDVNDHKIFDYRTLYRDESPELDSKLLDRMLQSIHEAAQRHRAYIDNDAMKGQPVEKGIFAKQKMSQAMENTTLAELTGFLDYLTKNPRETVGRSVSVWKLYALWVSIGTPSP
jgi:Flp pilus assembly protein TadD